MSRYIIKAQIIGTIDVTIIDAGPPSGRQGPRRDVTPGQAVGQAGGEAVRQSVDIVTGDGEESSYSGSEHGAIEVHPIPDQGNGTVGVTAGEERERDEEAAHGAGLQAPPAARRRERVITPLGRVCEPYQGGVACGRCRLATVRRQLRRQHHLLRRQCNEFQIFIRTCFVRL